MVDEIGAAAQGQLRPVSQGEKPETKELERRPESQAGEQAKTPGEASVSSGLQDIVERVKQSDDFRKDVVHKVLQELTDGELVTPRTIREAAERILREGV